MNMIVELLPNLPKKTALLLRWWANLHERQRTACFV